MRDDLVNILGDLSVVQFVEDIDKPYSGAPARDVPFRDIDDKHMYDIRVRIEGSDKDRIFKELSRKRLYEHLNGLSEEYDIEGVFASYSRGGAD